MNKKCLVTGFIKILKSLFQKIESFGRLVSHGDTTECHIVKPKVFCVAPAYNLLPSFVSFFYGAFIV